MDLMDVINSAGAIMLLAGALAALLTTPRRAEHARQRRAIESLQVRVGVLEDQLADERTRRIAAETAAETARERAEHVESFAVGRGAWVELLERLDRIPGTAA